MALHTLTASLNPVDPNEDTGSGIPSSMGMRMPSRFCVGTVKAAAWQVLAAAGPDGLSIHKIASTIQNEGLRDLRTSKTPEVCPHN
jgi:hypothetical protein